MNGHHSQILNAPRAMPGSVCLGSLRDRDLLSAFADELRTLQGIRAPLSELVRRCRAALEAGAGIPEDEVNELLAELFDALDELAPDGHYFGAHSGDGADFGFWPHDDAGIDDHD